MGRRARVCWQSVRRFALEQLNTRCVRMSPAFKPGWWKLDYSIRLLQRFKILTTVKDSQLSSSEKETESALKQLVPLQPVQVMVQGRPALRQVHRRVAQSPLKVIAICPHKAPKMRCFYSLAVFKSFCSSHGESSRDVPCKNGNFEAFPVIFRRSCYHIRDEDTWLFLDQFNTNR
jgi:hypothetical protein